MKIKIGFFAIALTFALILTHSFEALPCFLSAFLHELGHIAAARISNVRFRELRLSPFGASLLPLSNLGSFSSEIFICASGPAVNLLCALITLSTPLRSFAFGELFILSSLFLGILNLLPISSFDGGRILFCIIEQIFFLLKHLFFSGGDRRTFIQSFRLTTALQSGKKTYAKNRHTNTQQLATVHVIKTLYKIVNKKLVFNGNYYFCNKCLNELFGEIGKIILPKSPTPIFKKKGVKDE